MDLKSDKEEVLNKTSYDFMRRQKPISSIVSYNPRPLNRKGTALSKRGEATTVTNRYKNFVSHSTYGKEMVASYNSYFK